MGRSKRSPQGHEVTTGNFLSRHPRNPRSKFSAQEFNLVIAYSAVSTFVIVAEGFSCSGLRLELGRLERLLDQAQGGEGCAPIGILGKLRCDPSEASRSSSVCRAKRKARPRHRNTIVRKWRGPGRIRRWRLCRRSRVLLWRRWRPAAWPPRSSLRLFQRAQPVTEAISRMRPRSVGLRSSGP